MLNLAAAMPDCGLDIDLVVGAAQGAAERWIGPMLTPHHLGARGLAGSLVPLTRRIRAEQPDAVLSTMVDANVAACWATRWASRNSALVLRETNSHRARGDLGAVRRALARQAYRRAELVVALSEGVRLELIEDMALAPDRVVTIPNPIMAGDIARQAEAAKKAPPPWRHPEGTPVIVSVARLHRQKGLDVLLDALANRDGELGRAHLYVLGEGPERAALTAQAARLGLSNRVHMPGFIGDVVPYVAHADLFVLSSRWEGFGHVIVEAMAAGVPVVSTDCPHGPADIIRSGENGLLVKTGEAAGLGDAMARLLSDRALAQRLAAAGAASSRRYEASRVAGEYAEAIGRAIAWRRARLFGSAAVGAAS
jgi:glycosyltransferase involved in cell wall biosynthesis